MYSLGYSTQNAGSTYAQDAEMCPGFGDNKKSEPTVQNNPFLSEMPSTVHSIICSRTGQNKP